MPTLRRFHTLLITLALCGAGVSWGRSKEAPFTGAKTYALSLEEFSEMALNNSLRSQIAESNFSSAKWGWKASRRNLSWPTLEASAEKNKTFDNNDQGLEIDTRNEEGRLELTQPFLTGTRLAVAGTWSESETQSDTLGLSTTTFSRTKPAFTASITQPLFVFTGNESWRSKKTADLQWANNQDSYRSEVLSIEFDARTRYYNLLLQRETTEVERKKLESAKLINDVTRALVRAGKLAEVEAVRADIRAKKDYRRIQNSESALEKALNEAKDFLYLPSDSEIKLTSQLSYKPFSIPLNKLVAAAIQNNPDLLSAERNIALSEIDLKNTRENDNLSLNAVGTYERTRNRSDDIGPVDPYAWTVGVDASWPLFDATQTRLRTRQAEVSLLNTKRSYENQTRDLKVDVENAYLEIKRVEDQISDFEAQRISAQRNVNAIRLQYRNGLTRLTDVFDAENELRDLELEYLNLLVNFNAARDRLKVLVGRDLDNLDKGTP